jgi:hypothetical protein
VGECLPRAVVGVGGKLEAPKSTVQRDFVRRLNQVFAEVEQVLHGALTCLQIPQQLVHLGKAGEALHFLRRRVRRHGRDDAAVIVGGKLEVAAPAQRRCRRSRILQETRSIAGFEPMVRQELAGGLILRRRRARDFLESLGDPLMEKSRALRLELRERELAHCRLRQRDGIRRAIDRLLEKDEANARHRIEAVSQLLGLYAAAASQDLDRNPARDARQPVDDAARCFVEAGDSLLSNALEARGEGNLRQRRREDPTAAVVSNDAFFDELPRELENEAGVSARGGDDLVDDFAWHFSLAEKPPNERAGDVERERCHAYDEAARSGKVRGGLFHAGRHDDHEPRPAARATRRIGGRLQQPRDEAAHGARSDVHVVHREEDRELFALREQHFFEQPSDVFAFIAG